MITANDGFINQSERYSTENAGQSLKKYILLKKGELAYNHGASKLRPYGSCFALKTEEEARIPFVYHCFSTSSCDPEFLSIVLNGKSTEKQLRRIVSSGARMDGLLNISYEDYTSIPIMIPSLDEQNKISACFEMLDDTITLHQCKHLQDYNGSFKAEFVSDIARVTATWEQRKFQWLVDENIIDIPMDGNHGEKHPTSSEYVDNGIPFLMASDIHNGRVDLTNCKFISEERSKRLDKGFAKNGDVLITHKATIGEVAILSGLQPEYAVLTPQVTYYRIIDDTKLSREYLYAFFNSDMFQKEIKTKAAQSTRAYIGISAQRELSCSFPESLDEQNRIGATICYLDNLITLHQCKHLWDQNDSFRAEFVSDIAYVTATWEQRKFDEITYPAGTRNKDNLPLAPYSITNDKGFLPQNEAHEEFGYMQNTDRKAYIVVTSESFGYNPARINVGSIGYYEGAENVIVSSLYEVFKTEDYIDDHFLMHWFKSDLFPRWIDKFQEGSVRQYFYYDKLCECSLTFPSLEEQRKISALIDSIDETITLHQCKHFRDQNGSFKAEFVSDIA